MIFERFSPIDEDDWNLLAKLRIGGTVFKDIDFPEFKRLHGAQFGKLRFDRIAQAATGLGEKHNFSHHRLMRF
jgi:hypothetical protein